MVDNERLSKREMASIQASFSAIEKKYIDFAPLDSTIRFIESLWEAEAIPFAEAEKAEIPDWLRELSPKVEETAPSTAEDESPDWLAALKPETEEPAEWYVGMSDDFVRSLRRVDRKLKGRILDAMADICREPITPKGNTVKPLTAKLKGLWRYRIGDFRLVYQPNSAQKCVTLLQ